MFDTKTCKTYTLIDETRTNSELLTSILLYNDKYILITTQRNIYYNKIDYNGRITYDAFRINTNSSIIQASLLNDFYVLRFIDKILIFTLDDSDFSNVFNNKPNIYDIDINITGFGLYNDPLVNKLHIWCIENKEIVYHFSDFEITRNWSMNKQETQIKPAPSFGSIYLYI